MLAHKNIAIGMICEFGPSAPAQANAVAARMAKLGHADGEATWKAIAKAIEEVERSKSSEGPDRPLALDPVNGCRCPRCGAPRSQLALDCREFASGVLGFVTCTCNKCGHKTAPY
jgi:hypothetical protein